MSKTFLASYPYRGQQWNIEIPAESFDEAEERLKNLCFAKVDGELKATIKAPPNWLARFLSFN